MSDDAVDRDPLVARLRAAGCVFAEEEAGLILDQADDAAEVERLVQARVRGLPLEQVLGWAELAGVRVALAPGVFVPRQRTALLVAEAVRAGCATAHEPVVLLDLCCGSGAVGLAVTAGLAARLRQTRLTAADLDPAAVACARTNLPGPSRVVTSDLFTALPSDLRGRVDVLTANVPYVPTAALALMPREAREHEPRLALDGGADGLDLLRRVAAEAPRWLAPGGTLLTETSEEQEAVGLEALADAGLHPSVRTDEDLGATVLLGRRSRRAPGARR